MLAISAIGAGAGIWFALGVVVTFRNDAGAAWRLLLALLVTIATVDLVLKPTFARTRPYVAHAGINVEGPLSMTYSFPSGHAATAAAGALGLSRVWSHATPALWALALLIAGSRVYLGVHYPGDVLFGLLVGCGCAYFVTGGMAYKSRRSSVMNSRRSWMFGRQSAVGRQVSPCTLSLSGVTLCMGRRSRPPHRERKQTCTLGPKWGTVLAARRRVSDSLPQRSAIPATPQSRRQPKRRAARFIVIPGRGPSYLAMRWSASVA